MCCGDRYLACGHESGAVTFHDLRSMGTVCVERGRLREVDDQTVPLKNNQ